MAGSFFSQIPADPILSARIEALSYLAGHIQEPVVILTPSMDLVYVNDAAMSMSQDCPLVEQYIHERSEACTSRSQCEVCPAKTILDDSLMVSQEPSHTDGLDSPSCPFSRAVALLGGNSRVGSVVLMGQDGYETVLHRPMVPEPSNSAQDSSSLSLLGTSQVMAQVAELISLVASSEAPVLIQGESGTGKELAARTIHALSSRKAGPFVVVDCGSLTETLLESELFGHVRGAFTGAVSTRKGLFEEAQGGTIFLDEISNTSQTFQAKLLRVLQETEVKPVGSNQSIQVNVRVLSATNIPLEQLVKGKQFRADLFYRLAVLPITIPPLRDRLDDIPLLVDHFVRRACESNNRTPLRVLPEVYQELMSRGWPGNVRELEHFLERAVLMARGCQLTRDDVLARDAPVLSSGDLASVGKGARARVERMRILEALRESQGSRTKAAKILNISRAGLYNKLREYHIS